MNDEKKWGEKKRESEHLFWTAMPFFCGPGLALPHPKQYIHVSLRVQLCEVVPGQSADVRDKQNGGELKDL